MDRTPSLTHPTPSEASTTATDGADMVRSTPDPVSEQLCLLHACLACLRRPCACSENSWLSECLVHLQGKQQRGANIPATLLDTTHSQAASRRPSEADTGRPKDYDLDKDLPVKRKWRSWLCCYAP